MLGPSERGHWSGLHGIQSTHEFLEAGRRYRVVREFTDFDGGAHLPGEEWAFLGASFLPHDDGLSLFVSLDGLQEWHIRLQWRAEAQGDVLDPLSAHVEPL